MVRWDEDRRRASVGRHLELSSPSCAEEVRFVPAALLSSAQSLPPQSLFLNTNSPPIPVTFWRCRKEPGPAYSEVPRRCCGTSSHVL